MKPFVHIGLFSKHWYVDVSRDDATPYPGTSWGGYHSLIEAMNAARAAYVPEPA